jgi:hypothetical protein
MTGVGMIETRPEPARLSAWERLSDHANPILVRELQQSLKSRSLVGTILLALLSIFVIACVISSFAMHGDVSGRDGFAACFGTLVPFVALILPMQAFYSMMHEVRDGTVELLLLSRLTPRAVVRGKLQATGVLFVVFLALFAPPMALTWCLRGVSVPMILIASSMAFLLALTCTSFAIAAGAVARSRQVTAIVTAVVVAALGAAAIGSIAGGVQIMEHVERASRAELELVVGSLTLGLLAALVLFSLIAKSQLTHPVENRTTAFRAYFAALPLTAFAWIGLVVDRPDLTDAFAATSMALLVTLAIPAVMMTTEDHGLSPRVRLQVPRRGAALAALFFPGGALGLLYMTALLAFVPLVGLVGPMALGARAPRWQHVCLVEGTALYVLIYAALAGWIRSRLAPGVARSWLARAMTLTAFAILLGAPALAEAVVRRGHVSWSWLHVMNPFYTLDRFSRDGDASLFVGLGLIAVALIAVQSRRMLAACREVAVASRARRARRAPG